MQNRKIKEVQEQLLAKENDVIRGAKLYSAKHLIEFTAQQEFVCRVALRKFYEYGVFPLVREIDDHNVKLYPSGKPEK